MIVRGGQGCVQKNKSDNNKVANDVSINRTIIAAVKLRELVFATSDESLIRTMDLLIYAIGRYASNHRVKDA